MTTNCRPCGLLSLGVLLMLLQGCKKEPELVRRGKPQVTINAGDSRLQLSEIRLSADTVYILATNLVRNDGQSLVIDAGTLIKVNDRLSVVLNEGAMIEAKGTAALPIIFTSSAYAGGQGLQCGVCTSNHIWNGIIVNGNYLTAAPAKTSGDLSFVRVEFAGGSYEAPSLLIANVNQETVINNIQVSYSSFSPSIELSGGNVNLSNLISYASNSTDFYIHGGFTGMMQNMLAYRHPYFPVSGNGSSGRNLAGLYIDGGGDSATSPIISNLTVLGTAAQPGTSRDYFQEPPDRRAALLASGASRFHIRNSVFMGFPKAAFYIDDYSTARALHFGESEFSNCIVHSNDTSRTFYLPLHTYEPFNSSDFKGYMLQDRFANRLFLTAEEFAFADPFNYDIRPDAMPKPGSPLLAGANFDSASFSNAFFEKVDYIGALGSINWMDGWTNFIPLQTNYNN